MINTVQIGVVYGVYHLKNYRTQLVTEQNLTDNYFFQNKFVKSYYLMNLRICPEKHSFLHLCILFCMREDCFVVPPRNDILT